MLSPFIIQADEESGIHVRISSTQANVPWIDLQLSSASSFVIGVPT